MLPSDRTVLLFYCILHNTVGPSFSYSYSYKWLCFLLWVSQCLSKCSSQLKILHSNLFEFDILGLADLAGDIYNMRKKTLMCIEIALISSYQL